MYEKEGNIINIVPELNFRKNQAESDHYGKLCERAETLEAQISTGENTNPAHLDTYLSATVDAYEWETRHPKPWQAPRQREIYAEQLARHKEVLTGSYHKEKATFCIEEASTHQARANFIEELQAVAETPEEADKARNQAIIQQELQFATNWLQTAANCLNVPEEPRPAPTPA